jgi:predicted RNase H-like nuclease (RuvC/YqgF family)
MKPPKQSQSSQGNQEPDFEQELEEVERSLLSLKERYAQVQRDRFSKAELQQRLNRLNQNKYQTPEIKAELRQIKQQLEVLELNLESQLFSWGSLKKPFWQAVRFGGMGVIIGWILKSCAG